MILRDRVLHIQAKLTKQLQEDLGGGAAKSMEDYRYIVGRIQGMADLMREIDDTLSNAEKYLDDTGV